MQRTALLLALSLSPFLAASAAQSAAVRSVIEWTFDGDQGLAGWQPNSFLADVRVGRGIVAGRAVGRDPYLTSPRFEIPAHARQEIHIRLRSNKPGHGEVYWTNTLDTRYAGFSPGKRTGFDVAGGDEWQVCKLRPFWQAERKIILLRLDLHRDCTFEIDWVRVVGPAGPSEADTSGRWDFRDGSLHGWVGDGLDAEPQPGAGIACTVGERPGALLSPALSVDADSRRWLAVQMRSQRGRRCTVRWACDVRNGMQSQYVPIRGDGQWHTVNIDIGATWQWRGKALALELTPSHTPGDRVDIRSIELRTAPGGEPDLEVLRSGLEDALCRVGRAEHLMARFINRGAATAERVTAALSVPEGVTVVAEPEAAARGFACTFDDPVTLRYRLKADRPVEGEAVLRLAGPGAPAKELRARLRFTPAPNLPQGAIPEPTPAQTDYLVGSYYYPGFETTYQWRQLERTWPVAKPLLGYYDEANPECLDWQIKWAVEHGVRFFLVDWYWRAGHQWHTHYLEAFMKARFRRHFKWAIMWANHNPPKSHSMDDFRAVVKHWIEHYLRTPEYLHIDGKPAVFMWAPGNLRRDLGGVEGAAEALAMVDRMVRDAGLPGITFVSMRSSGSPSQLDALRQEGYRYGTSYHWWADARSLAPDPRCFPFSLVVDRSRPAWDERAAALKGPGLGFIPVADTGWDSRPRHGDRSLVIHGRTPDQFERLLREAKSWLDARGRKMLILGPWNEWTEGSYVEPCTEFGFGMVEAVRKVFCKPGPAPALIGPRDVGLGPYDLPIHDRVITPVWTFDREGEGWKGSGGLAGFSVADGAIVGKAPGDLISPATLLQAPLYTRLEVRMKLDGAPGKHDEVRLMWTTATRVKHSDNAVIVPAVVDGKWRVYALPLAARTRWRGSIRQLRLRLRCQAGVTAAIDSIRLE